MKKRFFAIIVIFFITVIGAGFTLSRYKAVDLIFSHKFHVEEAEAECLACHTSADTSTFADQNLLPSASSCFTCHDSSETECKLCHKAKHEKTDKHKNHFAIHSNQNAIDLREVKKEILHNHRAHSQEKIACETCHTHIKNKTGIGPEKLPEMLFCMDCHKEKKMSNQCEKCHTDPELTASHKADWKKLHGELFSEDQISCGECHSQNHCDQCHRGLVFEEVHRSNYRYTHAMDAFGADDKCGLCHMNSNFCDDCHIRSWGRVQDHQQVILNTTSCKQCHD